MIKFGSTFDQQGGFGGGMNWDDFMKYARQGGGGATYSNVDFGDLGDILSEMFGGGFGFGGRKAGLKQEAGAVILKLICNWILKKLFLERKKLLNYTNWLFVIIAKAMAQNRVLK